MKKSALLFSFLFCQLLSFSQIDVKINYSDTFVCEEGAYWYKLEVVSGNPTVTSWLWNSNHAVAIADSTPDSVLLQFKNPGNLDTFYTSLILEANNANYTDSDTIYLAVLKKPSVDIISEIKYCKNDGIVNLYQAALKPSTPYPGQWYIRNQSSAIFSGYLLELSKVNGNINYLTYKYSDANQCSASDSVKLIVNSIPTISLQQQIVCQDIDSIDMEDVLVNTPGNTDAGSQAWRCLNCYANDFSKMIRDFGPTVGINRFTLYFDETVYKVQNEDRDTLQLEYTFTNAFDCSKKDTVLFIINKVPEIKFALNRSLCWNEGEIDLNELTQVNFKNGTWSCIGKTGFRPCSELGGINDSSIINTFNSVQLSSPSSNPNTFNLRYTLTATGCPAYNDTSILINPLPKLSLTPIKQAYCETEADVTLYSTPSGGSWSSKINGVLSGNLFIPSTCPINSSIKLHYFYVNPATGCSNKDSLITKVEGSPSVTLPPDTSFLMPTGSNTIRLAVKAQVANIPNNVYWDAFSSTGDIAKIVGSSASGAFNKVDLTNKPGNVQNHTFFVSASSGASQGACPSSSDIRMYIITKNKASVNSFELDDLLVYPNPTFGNLNIRIDDGTPVTFVEVFSNEGKSVFSSDNISKTKPLDLSDLTPGVYYVQVNQGTKISWARFIMN